MKKLVYYSLDCEASGPMAPLYNLLSIGVTILRPDAGRHVIGNSFYTELKPIFPGFLRSALDVCGLDVEQLRLHGEDPREAMQRLSTWVEMEAGPRGSPVFVGHNAVFDWAYIAYYFAHFDLENPFGYKGIDAKSLAMGVLGIPWTQTSKESLEKILGLPPQDPARVHRADYDAHYQAQILQRLLDRPRDA